MILWYHREAEGKNRKLLIHTQYIKGSLDNTRGFFTLNNVKYWYIVMSRKLKGEKELVSDRAGLQEVKTTYLKMNKLV